MTNERQARLEAKVKAVNRAHAHAVKLYDALVAVFTPLVGCKILKADNTLLQSVQKGMPDLGGDARSLRVYRNQSNYSLAWTVNASENFVGGNGCLYYEISVYVGDLDGQVLTKIMDPANQGFRRTDYTAAEVAGKRDVFEKAKKVMEDAKSDLWPFGENDR